MAPVVGLEAGSRHPTLDAGPGPLVQPTGLMVVVVVGAGGWQPVPVNKSARPLPGNVALAPSSGLVTI